MRPHLLALGILFAARTSSADDTCEGVRVLQILPSPNPEWSVAILTNGNESVLRKAGGTFAGGTVLRVDGASVLVARDGGTCRAYVGSPQPVAPNEITISRVELAAILQWASERRSGIRVIPEIGDGHPIGVRILGIRPREGLAKIGLENGDRLETINGYDLSDPNKALEAYARLRTADRLVLHVVRKGSPLDIAIAILP